MIRTILLVAFALALAIGGGAGSVWYALGAQDGVGAVPVAGWTAFPNIGTPDADPYSKARVAREGVLALGRAEGLTFIAQQDVSGASLARNCRYLVDGTTPLARFWTLYVADADLVGLDTPRLRKPAINSLSLLRNPNNSFAVAIGAHATPGNWLGIDGTGPFTLVLNLYDTPVASSSGVDAVEMPRVTRTGCDE